MGEEGKDVRRLGLHHLEQVLRKNGVIAGEADAADDEFGSLVDGEGDAHLLVGKFGGLQVDLHVSIVAILVELEDFLTVLVEDSVIEGPAGLGRNFLADLGGGNGLRTLDEHLADIRSALQQHGHLQAARNGFRKDSCVGNAARGVERLDVLLDEAVVVRRSDLGRQVIKNTLLAQRGRADKLNIDLLDGRSLRGSLG